MSHSRSVYTLAAAVAGLIAASSGLTTGSAAADTLVLRDGQVLEGKVTERDGEIHIETPTMIYAVSKSDVKEIKRADAGASAVPAAAGAAIAPKPAAAAPPVATKNGTLPPAELLKQAEEAASRKTFGTARTALQLLLRFHPDASEVPRAKSLLRDIPEEDGRLILGFDSAAETSAQFQGRGRREVHWVSDKNVVPHGEGAAHIVLQRGVHAKFPIPSQTLATMKTVNFWVWAEAPIVGMTGTTYFCLYTDDPGDFLSASFQVRGDGVWRQMSIDAGRFKRHKDTTGRRFTAAGFWNPSPELRDIIVDEVRVTEETPPIAAPR
jgi:hypothetical protein